jgi:hypothetical protein
MFVSVLREPDEEPRLARAPRGEVYLARMASFRFHQANVTDFSLCRRQYAACERPLLSHRSKCRRQYRARSVIVHLRPYSRDPEIRNTRWGSQDGYRGNEE